MGMIIGCFLTSSKGFAHMGREALRLGGNTFQFFSRNPRGSKAKALDYTDAARMNQICTENAFGPLLIHAPYTLNLCSVNPDTRQFALETMLDDMQRLRATPGNFYNFHPGSHTGQGIETGIVQISEALKQILPQAGETCVLLETMAGKGSEVGGRFEELAEIISRVPHNENLGVCLDTCHIHDAGYDIGGDPDAVIQEFDRIIGLDRLKAIHINDSMNPLGNRKDRHAKIGHGYIGLEGFRKILHHPGLRQLPYYLETPCDLDGYAREMALLRKIWLDPAYEPTPKELGVDE